jgi:hypothetical protein
MIVGHQLDHQPDNVRQVIREKERRGDERSKAGYLLV